MRKVIVDPESEKSLPAFCNTPLRKSERLDAGLGALAKLKTAFVPLMIPCGISPSKKLGALLEVLGGVLASPFTILVKLATELLKPLTVLLNPPTVAVIVFNEFEMAFR